MAFCFAWRPAYRGQEQQNLGINVTGVCPIFGLQQIHECSERPKKSGLVKSQLWSLGLKKYIYFSEFKLGTTLFPFPVTML